jgi:hypothetical protein
MMKTRLILALFLVVAITLGSTQAAVSYTPVAGDYGYPNALAASNNRCTSTPTPTPTPTPPPPPHWLPFVRWVPEGWNSTIVVRNNSTSPESAKVITKFFKADGSLHSQRTDYIPANTAAILTPPVDGLARSAKVAPETADVSVVVETVLGNTFSHAYAGVSEDDPLNPGWGQIGTTLYAPVIMNNYYSWYSNLMMMNTGPTAASGNIAYYRSSDGQNVYNQSFTLAPNASLSTQYNNGATNMLYSARITSSQPLAAIVRQRREQNGVSKVFMSYNCVSSGSTTVHAPLIMNNYSSWDTSMTVQNTSASSASITMYYYNSSGSVVKTSTDSIPAYSSHAYYTPNQGLADGFIGTARVTSNKPVVVVVNQSAPHGSTPKRGLSYNGTSGGSTLVVIPDLMNYWGTQNWVSSVNVKNLSSTTSTVATLTYGGQSYNSPTIQPNGSKTFYVPNYAGGTSRRGWATVSASQPVAVVVNHSGFEQPNVDLAFSYTASNR